MTARSYSMKSAAALFVALLNFVAMTELHAAPKTKRELTNSELELVAEKLHIKEVATQELSPLIAKDGSIVVPLNVKGQTMRMTLSKKSPRAAGFMVFTDDGSGKLVSVEPPPVSTYEVIELRDAKGEDVPATGIFSYDGATLAGRLTQTESQGTPETIVVQPLKYILAGSDADNLYQVGDAQNSLPRASGCGVPGHEDEDVSAPPSNQSSNSSLGGGSMPSTFYKGNSAVVMDYCFYALEGTTHTERLLSGIARIERIALEKYKSYDRLGVRGELQVIVATTQVTPCTPDTRDATTVLNHFGSYWNSHYRSQFPQIGNQHLFTARQWIGYQQIAGITPGLGTWCTNSSYAAELVDGLDPLYAARVYGHEEGHDFNAWHCDTMPGCGLMLSNAGAPTAEIDPWNEARIAAFVQQASCLRQVPAATQLPLVDHFTSGVQIDRTKWDRSQGATIVVHPRDQNQRMLEIKNNRPTQNPLDVPFVESLPLDLTVGGAMDDNLKISFNLLPGQSFPASSLSRLKVQYLNEDAIWRTAETIAFSLLTLGAETPNEIIIPQDTFHNQGYKVRFLADLRPGESILLSRVSISLNPVVRTSLGGGGLTSMGDIDRNAIDELFLAETRANAMAGEVKIFFNGDTSNPLIIPGPPVTVVPENFGEQVVVVGDLNSDGFNELAVGAPGNWRGNMPNDGAVYIYSGSELSNRRATLLYAPIRGVSVEEFGIALSRFPDADGDGVEDMLVGAPGAMSGNQRKGAVYIVSGRTGQKIPGATMYGQALNDRFGCSMDEMGDINNDTKSDVVVGMCSDSRQGYRPEYVKVLSGALQNNMLVPLRQYDSTAFTFPGNNPGPLLFGYTVSNIGDFNGQGSRDIAIGVPSPRGNCTSNNSCSVLASGHVVIVSTALNPIPAKIIAGLSNQVGYFGMSVAPAGDLNGDGADELAIGDPYYTDTINTPTQSGRVWIYKRGSGNATNPPELLMYRDASPQSYFSQSLASGDRDGDGITDLAVGAPGRACGWGGTTCIGFAEILNRAGSGTTPTSWRGGGSGVIPGVPNRNHLLRAFGEETAPSTTGITLQFKPGIAGRTYILFGRSVTNSYATSLGLPALVVPDGVFEVPFSGHTDRWSYPTPQSIGRVFMQVVVLSPDGRISTSNIVQREFP